MSKHFLVVNPYLTYFSFAQRINAAAYSRFLADHAHLPDVLSQVQIVPYTKELHRTLKAQKSSYYSIPSYVPVMYMQ